MKKTIAFLILISMLVLSSCEYLPFLSSNTDTSKKQNEKYYAVKTLYSFEDVLAAREIVKKKDDIKSMYTVDNMGDNYTVLYQFVTPHSWTTYPIDYETYFNTKSNGFFVTYIFIKDQPCPGHEEAETASGCGSSGLYAYMGDEDYDRLIEYTSLSCVKIKFDPTDASHPLDEIEDISLLSYSKIGNNYNWYSIYYGEKKIMELWSCVELDKAFFDTFFNSIVIA